MGNMEKMGGGNNSGNDLMEGDRYPEFNGGEQAGDKRDEVSSYIEELANRVKSGEITPPEAVKLLEEFIGPAKIYSDRNFAKKGGYGPIGQGSSFKKPSALV
jgi:hypothetical protein